MGRPPNVIGSKSKYSTKRTPFAAVSEVYLSTNGEHVYSIDFCDAGPAWLRLTLA